MPDSESDDQIDQDDFEGLYKLQIDALKTLKSARSTYGKANKEQKKSTLIYHKKKLESMSKLQQEFNDRHKQLVQLSEDDTHDYFKNSVFMEFDELAVEYFVEVTDFSEELRKVLVGDEPEGEAHSDKGHSHQYSELALRLPKISLPEFSGQYSDWPSFHDSFNRLIHLNMQLSSVEKFRHLKSALPADFDIDIVGLPLTEPNYLTAWKNLVARYNNKRALFSDYVNKLTSLPRIENESANEIKHLRQIANACVTGLSQLNLEGDACGQMVVHILTTKLPRATHQQWETHLGESTEIPKFKEFMSFLNTRFRTLESWELFAFKTNSSSNANSNTNAGTFKPHTHSNGNWNQKIFKTNSSSRSVHTNHTHVQTKQFKANKPKSHANQSQISCLMCKEAHMIRSCHKFLNQDCFERKNTIDRLKLCLNCLSNSHLVSSCSSKFNCQLCGKRHNTLLHYPTQQSNSSHAPINSDNETSTHKKLNVQANNMMVKNIPRSMEVLLPTAIVLVRLNDGSTQPLRALLDQGSTGALISKHAVDSLKLPQYKVNTNITLPTGQKSSGASVVSLTITSSFETDLELSILACVVRKPTENLPVNSIK